MQAAVADVLSVRAKQVLFDRAIPAINRLFRGGKTPTQAQIIRAVRNSAVVKR